MQAHSDLDLKLEDKRSEDAAPLQTAVLEGGRHPDRSVTADAIKRVDDVVWTAEEESAVKRKIDMRMVPLLLVTFALTYYDKTVISMAVIYTFKKDLHLAGNDYQYASLIFYVGYIIGSFPCSYMAQKFHVGRSLAVMTLVWGFTVLSTVWCRNYKDLMIQRACLGFIEAGVAPTFSELFVPGLRTENSGWTQGILKIFLAVAVCGAWYTRREQVLRVAIFYSSTPYTSLWGPPLTYCLGLAKHGPFGASTWKNMFLFAGLLTISWAFVVYFFFPTDPMRARFLDPRQRDIALARLKVNNAGVINHTIKYSQIKECLLDYHFWALCVCGFAVSITNGTTSSFAFIVIKGYGFNNLQSLLFKMPWGFLAGTNMLTGAYLAGRYPNIRLYVYMAGCVPVIIGSALLWTAPKTKNPKAMGLVGYYLLTTFGMAYAQVMAMCGANFSGYTKKVTASAGLFVIYSVANIAALLSFQDKQAPAYSGGFTAVVISCACGLVCAIFLRIALLRRNRSREANGVADYDHAFEDLTDKENKSFRYAL